MVVPEYVYMALAVAIVILTFFVGIAIVSSTSKAKCSCSCKDCDYLEYWAWVSRKEKDQVLELLQDLPIEDQPVEELGTTGEGE